MVGEFLREAIDVEAAHAGDVLAQVLAAARAEAAGAADQRGIRHHAIALRQRGDAIADRDDLARRFGADAERELAFGERHAAEAPHVDVVQPDIAHAKLHFAGCRRRRRIALHQRDLAVGEQLQRADRGHGALCHSAAMNAKRRGQPAIDRDIGAVDVARGGRGQGMRQPRRSPRVGRSGRRGCAPRCRRDTRRRAPSSQYRRSRVPHSSP